MHESSNVSVIERPADKCPTAGPAPTVGGAVAATLVGFADGGAPVVEVNTGSKQGRFTARSCVPLHARDLWRELVVVFGDPTPFVIGVLEPGAARTTAEKRPAPEASEIVIDAKELILTAKETVTLRCGQASITLRQDGRVLIRGVHVVSHAAGVNRVRGGSVQLN